MQKSKHENEDFSFEDKKFPIYQFTTVYFAELKTNYSQGLGADDYMRRAGPLSRAGSVCRDLGTSVKHTKNQLRDYMEKFQPG